MEHECENCPTEVIHNCFTHCIKQDGKDGKENEKTEEEREKDTINSMERDAIEYGVAVSKRNLNNVLNTDGKMRWPRWCRWRCLVERLLL